MKICAVVGCSNSTRHIDKWRKLGKLGEKPFELYRFSRTEPIRTEWLKAINRKDPVSGMPWTPSNHSYVCSKHFFDGKKHGKTDLPCKDLGYDSPVSESAANRRMRMHRKRKANFEHSYCQVPRTLRTEDQVLPSSMPTSGDVPAPSSLQFDEEAVSCSLSTTQTCTPTT